MAKEVAKANNTLPAHLQGVGKTDRVGNIDRTDIIIPRVKLLQAISPEIEAFDGVAKAGEFWHSIASESMGTELKAVPVILRKSFVLWSPRNDERGILARAVDGLNWDLPGAKFTVKPKNSPHPVEYVLGNTVHEKTGPGPALSEFGSSIPGDPNSQPAAALTYEMLWIFLDFPQFSPSIIINTRSSVKPMKMLVNQIDIRPVPHYAQQYIIGRVQEKGAEGPYWNYKYTPAGYADEAHYTLAMELFNVYKEQQFKASDESEDPTNSGGGHAAAPKGKVSDDVAF